MHRLSSIIILVIITGYSLFAQEISPKQFGLLTANSDIERYYVLLKTHQQAVNNGESVSYAGIDRIDIEIPQYAKSIPLPVHVDFSNVTLNVKNNQQNCFLFEIKQVAQQIDINKKRIKRLRFNNKVLRRGKILLIIKDQNPWVSKRKGYGYGATREDILLLNHGKPINKPISSYYTSESSPLYSYCELTNVNKEYSDLIFERNPESTFITNLVCVENQNDITFKNIKIVTPESKLSGDGAFTINNCTNLLFDQVIIEGTYSSETESGYGIVLNNVWNARFKNLMASGKWGIFGNNNISCITIENSDINRFDIHCYGKDVYCVNTVFRNLYNQFSSFYGNLVFEHCIFDNFVPVLFESTYSAYTPFEIVIKDCVFNVDLKRPYLIHAGSYYENETRKRHELMKTSWPNIYINGLTINLHNGKDFFVFYVKNGELPTIADFTQISFDNIVINSDNPVSVYLSNKVVPTEKQLNISVSNSNFDSIIRMEK